MAGRQVEHIVDSIRLRRHRIGRALGNPVLPGELLGHVRRHPVPWVIGGLALGAVTAHLALPVLFMTSRGMVRRWLRSTLQTAGFSVANAVVRRARQAARATQRAPTDIHGVWEDASSNDPDLPLQASGGPVRPLSSS